MHIQGTFGFAFWCSILKSLNHFMTTYTVTEITSFEKHLERFSFHTLSFYPNLVTYRFKNVVLKESLTRSSTVILSTNCGELNAFDVESMTQ